MTFRLMFNPSKRILLGLTFIAFTASASTWGPLECRGDCVLRNLSDAQNCDLEKTPLARCESFREFVKIDERLNEAYRNVTVKLPALKKKELRNVQRDWIKYRDEQCETEEIDANCVNGVCSGVAHDSCILDLTLRRTGELREFARDVNAAREARFAFSKARTDLQNDD